MQIKKRYVAVVVVLLLCLTTFTFASPRQVEKQQTAKGISETVANDKKENNSYAEALEAVEEAEENPTLDTVETARNEINNADDATADQVTQLQNRVNVAEQTIDVAALVSELETLVSVKETRGTASVKYPTAATEVNNLEEGTVKNNLQTRLARVEKILNDTTNPEYTGITNNQITNENVTLTVTDDTNVTKTVMLNDEKVDFKDVFEEEGTYVVTLVDEAFNETVVTFTIDKTAPKFVDLKSGNHYETITVAVDDETATILVKNMDTGVTTEVANGTVLTEDATYYLTAKDAAGNEKSIWVAIDTTAPSVTGVDEENPTNKNEIVYVKDKFLTKVTIDGVEYTRDDFTVGANNENFSFQKKITKEGTHTVVAVDKYGNTTTKTFVIDKTAAKKNAVNANVNGYKNEVNEQYATNGNTVSAYISVNEELKYNPTFTFFANGKEIAVVEKDAVVASKSTNANYPYVYTATLAINEELVAEDGVITFNVTNIYDKAGNQTADITAMSRSNKVLTLDRTAATRVYSTVRVNKTEYDENGTKYYYVKNGDSFVFAMSFNELLAETPTVTIAGREVEMKLNEKVLANENKVLYEGTFAIDANEKELAQGTLEIKVSNVKDLAGNESTSETVTNQTKTSNGRTVIYDCKNPVVTGVNNKYYYTTPITIKAVDYIVHNVSPIETVTIDGEAYELGTEYAKEGTHEFIAYDRAGNRLKVTFTIDLTAPTLTVKKESVGEDPYYKEVSFKLYDNLAVDYFTINGVKIDRTNAQWSDANYQNIKSYLTLGENTIVLYDVAGHKTEKVFYIVKNTLVFDGNVGTVTDDAYLVDEPFYNDIDTEEEITINGNGKTVTQKVTSADKLVWTHNHTQTSGNYIPLLGNVFSSLKGAKVTVNDLTLTGTMHSVMLGNYEDSNSNWFNTEFNNVNIVDTEVVSFSAGIAPAVVIYGNATLNNVNITGTKRSALENNDNTPEDSEDRWPFWPVYDLAAVNNTNTTISGGKVGSMILWAKAVMTINNAEVDTIDSATTIGHLEIGSGTTVNRINMTGSNYYKPDVTIKAGATVKTLDLSNITNYIDIIVEDGAVVETVITNDGEMTYEEFAKMMIMNEAELAEAVNESGSYKLGANITISNPQTLTIAEGVNFNLNLNNYNLTNAVAGGAALENNGTLTITGNGTLANGTSNVAKSHTLVNNGTLVIEEGTYGTDSSAGITVVNNGTATINGGTFKGRQESKKGEGNVGYVFVNNAANAVMTINDATVNGKVHGLFGAYAGELIVNGGNYTLDGNNGLGCYIAYSNGKGKVFLNAGTIYTNEPRNNHYFYVYAGNKNYFDGAATNTGWIVADEADIYLDGVKLPY